MENRLLNTRQAADYLGVSPSFLEKDRWRGSRIPFIRISPRAIKYRQADLNAYVDSQIMHSTSEYEI